VSLSDEQLFREQVEAHDKLIEQLFGQKPKVFRNTELIYSDELGDLIYRMGFETIMTEGAKHILGWKSPNYIYCNALNPRQKVLMRNYRFSDDLSFRFSNPAWNEYPLTADKFAGWMTSTPENEDVINIFINYDTFGEVQPKRSGIFDFLNALPGAVLKTGKLAFVTPSEAAKNFQPISAMHVLHPISWADEERDLSAWLGNELQKEAFNNLYALKDQIKNCQNEVLLKDWNYLQANNHLYYMCTKFFSDGEVHKYYNPYTSPYEAFINYMNVLSDFTIRLNNEVPKNETQQEISKLKEMIEIKTKKLEEREQELKKLKKEINSSASTEASTKKTAPKRSAKSGTAKSA